MTIEWLGQSCFKIHAKGEHGQDVVIVIDPFSPSLGRKLPRAFSADIVLLTHDHPDHNYSEGVGGNPFTVRGPGEYEQKGVFVYGIATFHDNTNGKERGTNTMYHMTVEGMTLLHVGDIGHALSEEHLVLVEDAHFLFVPVGGGGTLSAKEAVALVSQIEPRIVIPMHYAIPGMSMKLESVDRFCREMGVDGKERTEKLRMTAKDLPQEEVRTIIFAPQ